MKTKTALIKHTWLLLLLSTLIIQPSTASAQGTAFTYQGSLNDNGSPANGTNYGMVFYLYDAPSNGTVLGNLGIVSVSVSNGLFTVPLDFGTNFPGADRWLEITVQKNGGGFTTLTPRQKINPTPYAITAANLSGSLPAAQLTGTIPATSIAGSYTSAITLNNPANNFTGAFIGNGAGLTNIPTSGSAWQLTGNAGTTAGVNFLGSTDNQPLELKVNGGRALRLEPTVSDPTHLGIVNLVGGSPANSVVSGTYGATISGGGAVNYLGLGFSNTAAGNFDAIGGGLGNTIQAGAYDATIGGGGGNAIQTGAFISTIAGGGNNTIQTNSSTSTIGGGNGNTIQTHTQNCTIAGGSLNTIQNQGSFINQASTIGGGYSNIIQTTASASFIGGGVGNTIQTGGGNSVIGGGSANVIQGADLNTFPFWATIGGGFQNTIQTNAAYSVISGGQQNTVGGQYATVSGGWQNIASALDATIGGGYQNLANNNDTTVGGGALNTASGGEATVGGGDQNIASDFGATVAGGRQNQASKSFASVAGGMQNAAGGQSATVGGGYNNTAVGGGATVAGGLQNFAGGDASFVGGGNQNTIQTNAQESFIGGGQNNTIQTNVLNSIISGGAGNTIQIGAISGTIGGGAGNTIQGVVWWSTIGGGWHNTNTGNYATVPGGDQNVAGANSFAAGHRAKANNTGAFVWADSTDTDFVTTADNQFLIRASGGVGIGANNPDAALTVNGTADKPGGGAWTVFSDARLKKNIEPLTGALNRLLELRAVTFEYKDPQSVHELPGIQIGMIAQEVEKVFPDWVDTAPNGMKRLSIHGFEALTVQALRELRAEKDAKISDLEKSNTEMQKQLATQKELNDRMAARFDALEKVRQPPLEPVIRPPCRKPGYREMTYKSQPE